MKEIKKNSDIDIRRGQKECPLLVFSSMLYTHQQAAKRKEMSQNSEWHLTYNKHFDITLAQGKSS